MKLLIVSPQPEHPPADAFRVFRALGEELSKRGHTVDYFVEPGAPTQAELIAHSPVTPTGAVGRGLRIAAHLNTLCKRRGYDFLLTAASLGWCLSTFRQWLLSPHTKVLSWHGGVMLPQPETPSGTNFSEQVHDPASLSWREKLARWAGKKAWETQDGYFFSATEAPEHVLAKHPEAEQQKVLYLPNGVANHYYFPERHQGQSAQRQPSRLLLSGPWDLLSNNPQASIIQTFTRMHEHRPDLKLSILKPGVSGEQVLSDFPPQVREAVTVLPDLDEPELIFAYQQHDIYLQAAPGGGGVPLSLLEAMAAAMPVVADDAPGVRDIIKHYENGLLIPAQDGNALEQSITHLLESPDLYRNLGENAFDYVSRYYTWRQVSDIFEAKLLQLQESAATTPANPD
jgi:glycosyltransferase involved in cell wall biosynthesis